MAYHDGGKFSAAAATTMAAKIGLTGGIGSGKSSVGECFASHGVLVIDADQIGRELCVPGTKQFAEIVAYFGDDILDSVGELDRKKLSNIVFESPQKRRHLEAILHPPIRAEMSARATADNGRYCILDIPLLVESGQHVDMDRVAVVTCSRETRIARLQNQRNLTVETITRIMKNQASDKERLAIADDVINNNDTMKNMQAQVAKLHRLYSDLFAR